MLKEICDRIDSDSDTILITTAFLKGVGALSMTWNCFFVALALVRIIGAIAHSTSLMLKKE